MTAAGPVRTRTASASASSSRQPAGAAQDAGRGGRGCRPHQGIPVQDRARPGQRLGRLADADLRDARAVGRRAVQRHRRATSYAGRRTRRSTSAASGMTEYLLTPSGERRLQAILSEIEPGGGSGDEPYSLPADVEFVFVVVRPARGDPARRGDRARSRGHPHLRPPRAAHLPQAPSRTRTTQVLWVFSPALTDRPQATPGDPSERPIDPTPDGPSPPVGPVDASQVPRFAGIATFGRLPAARGRRPCRHRGDGRAVRQRRLLPARCAVRAGRGPRGQPAAAALPPGSGRLPVRGRCRWPTRATWPATPTTSRRHSSPCRQARPPCWTRARRS